MTNPNINNKQKGNQNTENIWDKSVEVETSAYYWNVEPIVVGEGFDTPIETDAPLMIDLFSGCGGFSIGLEMAGFKSVLGLDIHKFAVETYSKNHPTVPTILGDIRKVPNQMILDVISNQHISLLTGGVPCQGFSLCNRKRNDQDQRNFLFVEFMRVAELIKPDLLLIENVSGITTAGNGSFKDAILKEMEGLGYNSKWTILNAVDFGVPQIRKRVIFIGVKNKNTFSWPTPTHGPHRKKYVTVKDAISDLPPLGTGQSENQYFKTPESDYQKLMRDQAFELLNHEAPSHPPETIERIKNTKPGEPMYPKFKQRIRLHFDKPSPTQVSGGIRPQFQFGHPSQPRGLTVRERCRIQSIPDTYIIEGGIVQGRVQTGNAVPPLLAKALGIELLKTLKGECEAPQIKSSIQRLKNL